MKFISRFFAPAVATALLIILANCTQSPQSEVTSNSSPAPTENSSHGSTSAHNSASTQNLTGEAKDVDYMSKLGLMKGHLLVAKELLDAQQPKEAEPHIGHPVEEIYADVEDQLQERNVPDFKNTLVSLHEFVKSNPKSAKVATNFDQSMQAVDKAIETIPEQQRQSPKFVLQVINELLDTANSEYKAAIANDKITTEIEYQDSRGFVNYADTLYGKIEKQMAKEHPDAHKAIAASMTKLKTAWPSAQPPAKPVLSPDEVSEQIKTIEQNAQKVIGS